MTAFDKAFEYTVGNEGDYSNDPADSGGPTRFGITQADYSEFLGRHASALDVKNMPIENAKSIYEKKYWNALSLDQISSLGVAQCMFDIGVVRGIGVPPRYAQTICNHHGSQLTVDGHIGPATLFALNVVDQAAFIRDFSAMAEAGFRSIAASHPSQSVFLNGWVKRARRLLTLISAA